VPRAATRMLSAFMMSKEKEEVVPPESVTPVVLYLAHEGCPENGALINALGGHFS